ncbi:hypothetical protein INS49_000470 [Diaporthe citri]|uniref:uncharacterized protein n=1 Tax=Diaporthe citri TaxID=83186 RepID=UPI001C7F5182|nr:uncharacterized protein INS49_000470 [Diaporthe citri]KAG6366294.1 hypothetical protein INS49_000470 [Diaporthe citri]
MAASVQYERDLRSANQEYKRGKDATVKWSFGTTASPSWWSASAPEPDNENIKARPLGKWSDQFGKEDKDKGNINKYTRTTGRLRDIPSKRVRSKVSAQEEIEEAAFTSRSVLDYLPSPVRRQNSAADNILYSFDRQDSPGRPLTLDIFVKKGGRETERFVEKEYEILDANGDALKGRKARRNLRRGVTNGSKSADDDMPEMDEDGFELV